ncbi:hypothetical protein [Cylindrospermopsis raciborskii]|uniref:Uncharacterized protein n=1 Tax=Cylindrospermopsis raciborskii CENA302 TaxID=1170768 RepID=A0A9Q5QWN7_9CYAN|nr:hypothetical protein [Cylindrospermopsis raciborskii]OHY31646.1 hypothetical protein BCV64_15550 [Cylindrospermopsis raciborskii MVCC14]OPH09587.1 hypothetical protein CENA302_09730 [Cylindrospermopsis raciborskii CENA302]
MELIGHYVNYRRQTSKSLSNLLPEEDYKLYGLTTHEPTQLMRKLNSPILSAVILEKGFTTFWIITQGVTMLYNNFFFVKILQEQQLGTIENWL